MSNISKVEQFWPQDKPWPQGVFDIFYAKGFIFRHPYDNNLYAISPGTFVVTHKDGTKMLHRPKTMGQREWKMLAKQRLKAIRRLT